MPNPENLKEQTEKMKQGLAKEIGAKGGRAKKGSKHISTHIKEMLNDENFEVKLENGETLKGRPMEAIIKAAVAKAASGDVKAFDILAKRGWGDKLDVTSGGKELGIPILGGKSVSSDDSDSQAAQTEQEN